MKGSLIKLTHLMLLTKLASIIVVILMIRDFSYLESSLKRSGTLKMCYV